MQTIGTLFSGGEGVGVGARATGLDHLWGVEWDDDIAGVARLNGFNTLTGDVRDLALMLSLPRPDVIHASPVCKNASNAKADGEESPEDIETADAVCAYIGHFRPDTFTLENVWGYRTFTAFAHIIECLNRNRYHVDFWHLNAANYGVPQTRQRLILVARLNGKPLRPAATHARPDKITQMFDTRLPWIGWYAAIEDLIDTLPPSKFAPWQLERLPIGLFESTMIQSGNASREMTVHKLTEPVATITSTAIKEPRRAFIVNGTPNDYGASGNACAQDDPIYTMTGSMDKRPARAFIMPNANSTSAVIRYEDEPSPVQGNVERVGNQPRAFLLGDQQQQIADVDEPSNTIRALSNGGASPRAWLSQGRVVKMTPRALARFQSIPDWYILPDKVKLACTIIGNMVPPLLYQRVIEAQRNGAATNTKGQ